MTHVLRCSDCDVPLVEHRPVAGADSERKQRSGFVVLKEWGLFFVLPIMFLATMLSFVALRENQFGIQIAMIIVDTGFVFLLVFCDTRGWKGYSLSEEAGRQKLPLLLFIHAGFLVVIFAGVTVAILIHPHLSHFWTLQRNRGGRGKLSNLSYSDHVSILTGVAIVFTQTLISRGILGRALEDKQRRDGSWPKS